MDILWKCIVSHIFRSENSCTCFICQCWTNVSNHHHSNYWWKVLTIFAENSIIDDALKISWMLSLQCSQVVWAVQKQLFADVLIKISQISQENLRDSNTGFSLLNFGNFKEHPFSQNIQHLWKHLRLRALQQYLTAFNRSQLLYVDPGYASERQIRNMLNLKKSYVANLMIKQNHSRFSSPYRHHHHHHHHHHHQQQQIFAVQLLIITWNYVYCLIRKFSLSTKNID